MITYFTVAVTITIFIMTTIITFPFSNLEKTLDSQVFTVSNLEELHRLVNRPKEIAVKYHCAPTYERTKLCAELWKECGGLEKLERSFSAVQTALESLGPWCADRVWKFMLDEISQKSVGMLDPEDFDIDQLKEEQKIIQRALHIVADWKFQLPALEQTCLSPKVMKLIQILEVFKTNDADDFCGIVFVERRHTANVLGLLLKE